MYLLILNILLSIALSSLMLVATHKLANKRLLAKQGLDKITNEQWQTPSFLLRRSGLYFGVIAGTYAITKNIMIVGFLELSGTDIIECFSGLVLLLLFLFTALKSADRVILSGVDNDKSVMNDKNKAVGLTEGAILFGTGIVAYGALLGEGHLLSSIIFFLIGQIVFVLMSYLMERVINPSHNTKEKIEEGDMPSAILVSSALISVSLFVTAGISGDFYGFEKDIPYFLKVFGIQFAIYLSIVLLFELIHFIKLIKLSSSSLAGAVLRAIIQLSSAIYISQNITI